MPTPPLPAVVDEFVVELPLDGVAAAAVPVNASMASTGVIRQTGRKILSFVGRRG
jgi:hypothetical protein